MKQKKVADSTLSFQYPEEAYEQASAYPTYYRALGLEPRSQHPFCMYEDTYRQPGLVKDALEAISETAIRIGQALKDLDFKKIYLTGLGSSFQLGAALVSVIWALLDIPAENIESSEALLSDGVFDFKNALVIGLSSSGNTVETVEHLKMARAQGAYTLAFTNKDETRLTDAAHDSFASPGGYGLVYDFNSRFAPIVAVLVEIARARGRSAELCQTLAEALAEMPQKMQHALETIDPKCRTFGQHIQHAMRSVVIPASGNMLPIAWEMGLRFEEMAHFPARGRPTVDFLHGGVGFIAPDILTIILAPQGKAHEFSLRVARVTRMVKTPSIAIIDEDDQSEMSQLADDIIRLPKTHALLKPMLYILPAELIPYYTEVARPGGNPDAQRTDQPNYARAFDIAMPPKSH